MIAVKDPDQSLPLADLARMLGRDYDTVLRWCATGVIGIDGRRYYLTRLSISGVWHTSVNAYRRFVAAQNQPADEERREEASSSETAS